MTLSNKALGMQYPSFDTRYTTTVGDLVLIDDSLFASSALFITFFTGFFLLKSKKLLFVCGCW